MLRYSTTADMASFLQKSWISVTLNSSFQIFCKCSSLFSLLKMIVHVVNVGLGSAATSIAWRVPKPLRTLWSVVGHVIKYCSFRMVYLKIGGNVDTLLLSKCPNHQHNRAIWILVVEDENIQKQVASNCRLGP